MANFGKSRGEGGSYGKSLPWGGMDIFWNHTLSVKGGESIIIVLKIYLILRVKCNNFVHKSHKDSSL